LSTRKNFIDETSDRLDQWMFVIVFALGAIPSAIFRLFLAESGSFSAYFTMIWLVTVMLGYAGLITSSRKYKLREDKAADNLYFLGFLFTVGALIISLLKFSRDSNPNAAVENNPLVVVEDLGIALVTTLVGLLLRVFLSQLRRDPEEIEEEVRLSLTEAADRVSTDIQATAEIVESASLLTKQVMEESNERLLQQQELTKKMIADGQVLLESAYSDFQGSIGNLKNRIEALEINESLFSDRLEPSLLQAEQKIEGFAQKVGALEIPSDLLSTKVEGALSDVKETLTNSVESQIAEFASQINLRLQKTIGEIEKEITVLVGNIEVSPELISSKMDPLTNSLAQTFDDFQRGAKPLLDDFTNTLKVNLLGLQNFHSQRNIQIQRMVETVSTSNSVFKNTTSEVNNSITVTLEQLSTGLADAVAEFRNRSREINQAIANGYAEQREQITTSIEDISSGVGRLDEKIRAAERVAENLSANGDQSAVRPSSDGNE
jgi:hypothetical protein